MFWGLILEPGKRYSQQVGKAFHISMATLETSNLSDSEHVPVMLEYEDGKEYLLCTLNKMKCIQCPLDLNFKEGEKIGFYSAVGRTKVHLTGYVLEELENDLLSEEEEEEEEDEEETVSEKTVQKRKESTGGKAGGKKIKLTEAFDGIGEEEDEEDSDYEVKGGEDENDITEEAEDEEEDDDDDEDDEEEEDDSDELTTPKAKKENPQQIKTPREKVPGKGPDNKEAGKTPIKEQNGQVKTPASQKKNKKLEKTPNQATPQKGFNKGGVNILDTVAGTGRVAKSGAKVVVYYTGWLKRNNKQFDATTAGAGFKFTLGRGEVIKGWDIGVEGMRVGGKRNLTIPSHLAYGMRGQPPVIPPDSPLVFDIELKNVF